MRKLRWGVLGAAKIAIKKVVPGMRHCKLSEVVAIASRNERTAQEAASELGLAKAYGSYEALLADPEIDVIYNPLPNHLHVPWSIRAAEAGKHVLCEKPISLSVEEARELLAARDRYGVKIGEAFMVRTHPQWLRTRELVRNGEIGDLRAIVSVFSYFNDDPANIRNIPDYGGGGLMDIGCYPITMSRFLFEREPERVCGLIERDPAMGTDRLSSAMLDFGSGQAVFTCSTQLVPYQTHAGLRHRRPHRVGDSVQHSAGPSEPHFCGRRLATGRTCGPNRGIFRGRPVRIARRRILPGRHRERRAASAARKRAGQHGCDYSSSEIGTKRAMGGGSRLGGFGRF